MKFDKETRQAWRNSTIRTIETLNKAVANQFTGEGFYDLGFRGKNHRPVLTLDGQIIASGMLRINEVLYDTMKYYHLW